MYELFEKAQVLRLGDVLFFAPLLIYYVTRHEINKTGKMLLAFAILTILHNGYNFFGNLYKYKQLPQYIWIVLYIIVLILFFSDQYSDK